MKKSHAFTLLGSIILILVILVVRHRSGPRDHSPGSQAPETGLSVGLAAEVVHLTGGEGEIVLVTADPEGDAYVMKSMKRILAETPGIRIVDTKILTGRFTDWPETDPLPPEDFLELMSQYSTATLVVSFVGVPVLNAAQLRSLPPPGQPAILIVYPSYYEPAPIWMDSGRVGAVIVPRRNPPLLSDFMPSTPGEWFDREFQVARTNRDLAD